MKIIIIGAGPAGMAAAIAAAENPDNDVVVLEKNDIPGKKLLVSGSGRCNVTNGIHIEEFFSRYGGRDRFVKPALLSFTNRDLMQFFNARHVPMTTMENGKVFPRTERSRDVQQTLIEEMQRRGVKLVTQAAVRDVKYQPDSAVPFAVVTTDKTYQANRVVIATGGKSYPSTGSTGDAYAWAESLGHTISTPVPALTPVKIEGDFALKSCAGIAMPCLSMTLRRGGRKVTDFSGDIIITHAGFSGPGILDNSRFMTPGDELTICWVDPYTAVKLDKVIIETLEQAGKKTIKNALSVLGLPDRLLETFLTLAGIELDPRPKLGDPPSKRVMASHQFFPCRIYGDSPGMTKAQRKEFVKYLRESRWIIDSLGDFNEAMVTAGGVITTEVNRQTMESRIVPGLFFAGEVLDVDADTGGFNLQWAFSSGVMAGKACRSFDK